MVPIHPTTVNSTEGIEHPDQANIPFTTLPDTSVSR